MQGGTGIDLVRASQHFPSSVVMGSALPAWRGDRFVRISERMLVREAVRGMQGPRERQRHKSLTNSAGREGNMKKSSV